MRKKIWRIFSVAAVLSILIISLIPAATPVAASSTHKVFPRNAMAPPGLDPMDATAQMLGSDEVAIRKQAAKVGPSIATGASPIGTPANVGDEIIVTVSDMGLNIDYPETFVVVMDGTHGIILVTKEAYDSFDGTYHFANPYGDGSEPWLRTEDLLTPAQLSYMLNQFDSVIYPEDTTVFGQPLARGSEGQKVWILIHNIRDEAYYDPAATSYVAGYFSASEDAANNKNMMHIDTYDWANRTGGTSARPYLYESTFAHEFEHLIHFDQDPDEESWVDEGLADLAGYLCGYGHDAGHIAYYMVYHPFTSLIFWGGGLESYGASYLFQLYLWEKYGGTAFTSALVQEQDNGIKGIQDTLSASGYSTSFGDIFDDWTIANYVDDTSVNPLYGYTTLTVGGIDTWGYSIEYALQNFWAGEPFKVKKSPIGFLSSEFFGAPQPYTAQYYRFGGEPTLTTALDGDDASGTPALSGTYEWYSGAEAWAWRSFYQSFAIPASGAALNFWTYFEIEEDWDYGYVEVHDLTTDQWYTLDAAGTVNYVAHAQDNPNVPAGREPADYEAAGRWHAFTGNSGGWVQVSMDLSPFSGHSIDLYFRTWQDGAFTLQMMYVDDISIPEIGFSDDVESGVDGWTADGWYRTDGILANSWQATLIETLWQPTDRYPKAENWHARKLLNEAHMVMDSDTQSGQITSVLGPQANSRLTLVLIVSNRADHILSSDYWVEFSK